MPIHELISFCTLYNLQQTTAIPQRAPKSSSIQFNGMNDSPFYPVPPVVFAIVIYAPSCEKKLTSEQKTQLPSNERGI